MEKKCRKCKRTKTIDNFPKMNLGKYWVWTTCFSCLNDNKKTYEIKRTPLKPSMVKIKPVSSTNKNTIAKFPQEIKNEIKARDLVCVYCGDPGTDYHHAYFWPIQANYWPNRNDLDQGVLLCSKCHYEIHHGKNSLGKTIRAFCIVYLQEIIKKVKKVSTD